jgi:hypothetical protein
MLEITTIFFTIFTYEGIRLIALFVNTDKESIIMIDAFWINLKIHVMNINNKR